MRLPLIAALLTSTLAFGCGGSAAQTEGTEPLPPTPSRTEEGDDMPVSNEDPHRVPSETEDPTTTPATAPDPAPESR